MARWCGPRRHVGTVGGPGEPPEIDCQFGGNQVINTLYLPELREMLSEQNAEELREFCVALHPARTAEFMEGLTPVEAWKVLQYADPATRAEIFHFLEWDRQVELLADQDQLQVAALVSVLSADDAVDLLQELPASRVESILALVPASDRRSIQKLQSFAEGTAGALMTTEAACLREDLTVRAALEELARQAEHLETVYYIYVVDDQNRLHGVVNTRRLVSAIGKPDTRLRDLMETDMVVAHVLDDQQDVAQKVAKFNLLAVPVVDDHNHMLGIITHDDIIDVVVEEATRDVQKIAAVAPLEDSYMRTPIFTLSWKRGMWLAILFLAGLLTAFALRYYEGSLQKYDWMKWFIPLIISSGGNSGSQSSTLVIAALTRQEIESRDWWAILRRELITGLLLGSFLALVGFLIAWAITPSIRHAVVIPITILAVVLCGTSIGGTLPLLFKRLGLDPALMSNPFVAGIIDILGILVYFQVAATILR